VETFEFYAIPENGVIRIPSEYRHKLLEPVKVIVQKETPLGLDDGDVRGQQKSDRLLPPTMRTKGWRFNRDEANERH
jgi:hypothetical protein